MDIRTNTERDLFGVFPIDDSGSIADHVGGWHHTLEQAEQHLTRVKEQNDRNYTVLSRTEFDIRLSEQRGAKVAFKTGHDVLMEAFDAWLKANGMIRGAKAAAQMGLTDTEFKSVIKRGLITGHKMPGHDNLVGFMADLTLTKDQHKQVINEITLNGHQVAEALGLTNKEFNEIRLRFNIMNTAEFLGRPVPNDSGTALQYSRADVKKLRAAIDNTTIKGV